MAGWHDRLNEALRDRGWSVKELARQSGVPEDRIYKYVKGEVDQPRGATMDDLATALAVRTVWLRDGTAPKLLNGTPNGMSAPATEMPNVSHGIATGNTLLYREEADFRSLPRNMPVMGTTAGAKEGAFQLSAGGEPIDYIRRPQHLDGARNAYALYVVNDSMYPKYEPGDPVFVHPDKPVQVGDYVVVQVHNHDGGSVEAYLKKLVRRTATKVVLEQFNPAKTMELKVKDIIAIHRVLTATELFGL
jgi:phage repressor protein C with HTH and peptisase S24 domain